MFNRLPDEIRLPKDCAGLDADKFHVDDGIQRGAFYVDKAAESEHRADAPQSFVAFTAAVAGERHSAADNFRDGADCLVVDFRDAESENFATHDVIRAECFVNVGIEIRGGFIVRRQLHRLENQKFADIFSGRRSVGGSVNRNGFVGNLHIHDVEQIFFGELVAQKIFQMMSRRQLLVARTVRYFDRDFDSFGFGTLRVFSRRRALQSKQQRQAHKKNFPYQQ